jgi:hypothetical protein
VSNNTDVPDVLLVVHEFQDLVGLFVSGHIIPTLKITL